MNKRPGSSLKKAFKIKAKDVNDFKNRDRIGRNDFDDLYRFKLRGSSSTQVDIDLSKFKKNTDLELYALNRKASKVNKAIGRLDFSQIKSNRLKKNLTRLERSAKKGKRKAEVISTQLDAGTYYIRVSSSSSKQTRYKLELATSPINQPPPPPPPINQPPSLQVNGGSRVNRGDSVSIIESALKATDLEDDDQSLVYTLTTIPEGGRLVLDGNTLTAGDRFTQADISGGRLSYTNLGAGRILQLTDNDVNDVASGISGFNVVYNQVDFAGDTQDTTDTELLNKIGFDRSRDVYLYNVQENRLVPVRQNDLPDFPTGISGSNIVGNTLEIFEGMPLSPAPFFYNGSSGELVDLRVNPPTGQTNQLIQPILDALNGLGYPPSVSETTVVWSQFEPVAGDDLSPVDIFRLLEIDFEIFAYDIGSGQTTQITNDDVSQVPIGVSGSNIVFQSIDFLSSINPFGPPPDPVSESDLLDASKPLDVFWYNGQTGEINQLSEGTTSNQAIGISETKIAWAGFDGNDTEIFLYDISTQETTQITDNDVNETIIDAEQGFQVANLSGDNLVWSRGKDKNAEIFFYDGTSGTTRQLTNNNVKDIPNGISGRNTIWSSFTPNGRVDEVFFYNGSTGEITQVTSDTDSSFAAGISGEKVVWNAFDGNDTEVFFADMGASPTSDSFGFTVTDSNGASTSGTFSINVT